jgi:hypothetical protein
VLETPTPRRAHLARLMSIWRSAGWPSRDAIEIDLLAAGWVAASVSDAGHETLHLTDAGIGLLSAARLRNQRAASAHDRLAERMAVQLISAGRIAWRELSLLAEVGAPESSSPTMPAISEALWAADEHARHGDASAAPIRKTAWRVARPDVFSIRNTSVEAYLQPMVHEIKVSRADLLSDLRHAAKRESYQWLSCETYYVFPAGLAEPHEIPEPFGIWALTGSTDEGALELLRPARHTPCRLPFTAWMALAKAQPWRVDGDALQGQLGAVADALPATASGSS